jgi:ribosomal-protein-alanine N-acetyltransferase
LPGAPGLVLRDFAEHDRAAFLAYQSDPRYAALYDLDPAGAARAHALFDRFLAWAAERPRRNLQLAVASEGRLLGTAGLRGEVLGIELAPEAWGRPGLAVRVVAAPLEFAFGPLDLPRVTGDTASGNWRVERLARWFGAAVAARAAGPGWMAARGWDEVIWCIPREAWLASPRRVRLLARGLPPVLAG